MRHISPHSPWNAGRVARLVALGAAGSLALSVAPATAAPASGRTAPAKGNTAPVKLTPKPTPAPAPLPDGFAGISSEDAYVGDDAYQAKQLSRQKVTGFTVVRQVFKWDELEPGPGVYEWSATDRFVASAARAKIRVMPLLFGEPAWGSKRPAGNQDRVTYPPADVQNYGRFAEAVARRYGPNGTFWAANPGINSVPVQQYQLWNEPNLPLYWGGLSNAREYSQLMIAGSEGLHRAQPGAYVISGGVPESKTGVAPRTFVATMLENGGAKAIDAIGVHPSGTTADKLVAAVKKFRLTINNKKVGGSKLALWVTEFGWAVGGPKTTGKTVSANQQSTLISDSFRGLSKSSKGLNLKGAIYFQWRDSPVYPGVTDFWGLHTGLVGLDGKDRPALTKLGKVLPAIKIK